MNNFSSELDRIAEEYYNNVYAYCLSRMMNVDVAFEITQTVFLSLCENYKNGKINNVERWLMKAAQNQVAQYLRDKYKEQNIFIEEELDDNRVTTSYNPFEEVSEKEIENIISCVMASLSDEERFLYESVFNENKTDYNTLSFNLNISQATLRQRISRLRKKIIKAIKSMLYCLLLNILFI